MTTPATRLTTSRRLFRRLVRILLPYRGEPVTSAALDAIAGRTFTHVAATREVYRQFAVSAYRELMDQPIPPPPLRDYREQDWRAALDRVAALQKDGSYGYDSVSPEFMERTLKRADLHVRNAERNQMVAFAANDDQIAGWARIDRMPPTCPLCRLTISRGPVYSSAQAAGSEGNDFHVGCTCEIVLVRADQRNSWDGVESFKAEERFYINAVKGVTGTKARAKAYRDAVKKDNARFSGATEKAAEQAVND